MPGRRWLKLGLPGFVIATAAVTFPLDGQASKSLVEMARVPDSHRHHLIKDRSDCATHGGDPRTYAMCHDTHYCCGVCSGSGVGSCKSLPTNTPWQVNNCACTIERDDQGRVLQSRPGGSFVRKEISRLTSRKLPEMSITSNFECGLAGGDRWSYNYCGGIHYCCGACNGRFTCQANGGWMLQDCACTEPIHLCGLNATLEWSADGKNWFCSCNADSAVWDAAEGREHRLSERNCRGMINAGDECCGPRRCKYAATKNYSATVRKFSSVDGDGCSCRAISEITALRQTPQAQRSRDRGWRRVPKDNLGVVGGLEQVCPQSDLAPFALPHTVFYTAREDPVLMNLTDDNARWPESFSFHFFDDAMLEASMVRLARALDKEGVSNLYRAFRSLRPWAFKADLWRYAILWACGGVYLDAKLRLIGNISSVLPSKSMVHDGPLLIVGKDIPQSYREGAGYWNGFLAATPRHPELLEALRLAIRNVKHRAYYRLDKGGLNITGPGLLFTAIRKYNRSLPKRVQERFELEETWVGQQKHNRLLHLPNKTALFKIDIPLHNSGKSDYWGDDRFCRIYCSTREPC